MSDDLVYSSAKGKIKKGSKSTKSQKYQKSPGPTKIRLEKKGRGGKQVTILFNLPFEENEAKQLMKDLQAKLACGGSFKDASIHFSGDMRDKIEEIFKSLGKKIVRSGG
ncbi:MAG: hypothetical protein AB8G05_18945 [Oligoflexales bacterium]